MSCVELLIAPHDLGLALAEIVLGALQVALLLLDQLDAAG